MSDYACFYVLDDEPDRRRCLKESTSKAGHNRKLFVEWTILGEF